MLQETYLQSLFGVAPQKVSDFFIVNLQVGRPHQEFGIFCTLACPQKHTHTHTHKIILSEHTKLRQAWTKTETECILLQQKKVIGAHWNVEDVFALFA